jgi:DNA polymerase III sliding clamp (beta) subunit (PCNA family)
MKLPEAKVELAAATESSRYTIQAVKLDVEKKRIMATDGYILAIVPCEVSDKDQSALISTDTIKQIRAMQKRAKSIPVEVTTNGKAVAVGAGETAEYELANGQFPNVDMVIPKGEGYEGGCTVCLNADLLLRLAKALQPEVDKWTPPVVQLWIKDQSSSVLVKCSKNPEAVGVIMPCRP